METEGEHAKIQEETREEWNNNHRPKQQRKEWRRKVQRRMYAQPVEQGREKRAQNGRDAIVHITVKEESTNWLQGCFAGRLIGTRKVQGVKDGFIMEGLNFIRIRYLGDKYVLLFRESEGVVKKAYKENKDWFEAFFESVVPWNNNFAVEERLVWVRCRGLPFRFWSRQCFEKVRALVGTLVEVDVKISLCYCCILVTVVILNIFSVFCFWAICWSLGFY